jgi:hypothetical protein
MAIHQPTGLTDIAELGRQVELPQPELDQHVPASSHGAEPPAHRARHNKHEEVAPLVIGQSRRPVSGELGGCSG